MVYIGINNIGINNIGINNNNGAYCRVWSLKEGEAERRVEDIPAGLQAGERTKRE
jgi:hypothetical protein